MALILGASSGDILSWRGTTELFASLRNDLAEKRAFLLADEGDELLRKFRGRVAEEVEYEERFERDLQAAYDELARGEFDDDLARSARRLEGLNRAYFERRGSVIALHALATSAGDALLRKALDLAETGLALEDGARPPLPYCWCMTGAAGRLEATLRDEQRHFLVYDDSDRDSTSYYDRFVYRLTAVLKKTGIIQSSEREFLSSGLWRGSLSEWRQWLQRELREKKHDHHSFIPGLHLGLPFKPLDREDSEIFRSVATVADLRPIGGEDALAADVICAGGMALDGFRETSLFEHVGKQVAVLPVALSLFGRLKVEKSGSHRGQVNIDQHALNPLVMNICLLAVRHGIRSTSTIERIRGLLGGGHLSVDMAEKGVRAYHEIASRKIWLELQEQEVEDSFVDPEELGDEEGRKLKTALETVVAIQKMLLHGLSEHM